MRTIGLMGCAAASLALAGCGGEYQSAGNVREGTRAEMANPAEATSEGSHPMGECLASGNKEPDFKDVVYVFYIELPSDLNKPSRKVTYRENKNKSKTNKNESKKDPTNKEPFHVFLGNDVVLEDTKGFLQVRINKSKNSSLGFFNKNGIRGVAAGVPGSEFFCSSHIEPAKSTGYKEEQTAVFYIDIQKFYAAVCDGKETPFNIWLEWVDPKGVKDTPIIIDPKVRNEGEA